MCITFGGRDTGMNITAQQLHTIRRERDVVAQRHRDIGVRKANAILGRGDDTVGNPHRAQLSQFESFELSSC